jgi:hypothetical protein
MAGFWWNAVIDRFSGNGAFSPRTVIGHHRTSVWQAANGSALNLPTHPFPPEAQQIRNPDRFEFVVALSAEVR